MSKIEIKDNKKKWWKAIKVEGRTEKNYDANWIMNNPSLNSLNDFFYGDFFDTSYPRSRWGEDKNRKFFPVN